MKIDECTMWISWQGAINLSFESDYFISA